MKRIFEFIMRITPVTPEIFYRGSIWQKNSRISQLTPLPVGESDGQTKSIKSWISFDFAYAAQDKLIHHDKFFNLTKTLTSLFLLFFFIGCANNLPEEILPGEHKCEFCKMGVVNQNYHSQILTQKGRRYHFDSIECMFSFWNHNADTVKHVWVKNYQNPKEWIEIENANFLKSEKLPSPMAANLSSYKSIKEAEDNRLLYGGMILTQKEVMEYVKLNWEKELSQKRE